MRSRSRSKSEEEEGIENNEDSEEEIKRILGFTEFTSSKGKSHKDSSVEYVYRVNTSKRNYRTYQNKKPKRPL